MGREARRVSPDWNHPKDEYGRYIPLLTNYERVTADWDEHSQKWSEGLKYNGIKEAWIPKAEDEQNMAYEDWDGKRPRPENYMPEWTEKEATHYMMYETATEGTPISPAFATPEELARWLADNRASLHAYDVADYETWLDIINAGKDVFTQSIALKQSK